MQVTRKEILEIIRREGQATVDLLARRLSLTSTCVRQHLSILERAQLVSAREERRKMGRPQFVYTLTETADDLFPKSYHLLTTWMLDELKALDGGDRAREVLAGTARRWAETVSPRVSGETIEQRVEDLVSLLKADGHLVEWEKQGDRMLLYEYDCRFQRVAQAHPEICLLESSMLSEVLGAPVEALECLIGGQSRCAYGVNLNPAPSL